MKRIFTVSMAIVLAMLMGTTMLHAASLTVFDGNQVSPYVPLPTAAYNEGGTRGQVIFPAEALQDMVGQPINGFTMYINDEGCKMNGGTMRVSVKEVENTAFSTKTFVNGLTTVARVGMTADQHEVDIIFDAPFDYEGGNLLIDFYVQMAGESGAYNFTYFYGLFQQSHTALTTGDEGNEYREFIPKTTFYYGDLEPVAALVNPRDVTFNTIRVGERDEKMISLTNTGLNAFTPVVTVNAPFSATVSQATVQPGETAEIIVAFEPAAPGLYEATLQVDCGYDVVLEVPMTAEALQNGTELVVAEGGATNQYLPFNGIYTDDENTIGQMIYPASMLTDMQGKNLVALSFFTSSTINLRNVALELSLMNTDQDEFASATPITGMTTVATTDVVRGETMITFEFDQPFEYAGDNLAVQVKVVKKSAVTTATTFFLGVNTENYAGLSCYKSWSGDKKERQKFLPKAAFLYQDTPAFERGDVDKDGQVGIGDVTSLIDYILNGTAPGVDDDSADCDLDGAVSIGDVTSLIDYVLNGVWPMPL
ncbi:MAG: hypothetical protein IJK41_02955 [Muribaculaceae bacterium]|nr:hypothetical protein [Muribaculaceae bacterium]